MKYNIVINPIEISKYWNEIAAKPNLSPSVFPTHEKTPPSCQPSTVAISAAHRATGINHKNPPANK